MSDRAGLTTVLGVMLAVGALGLGTLWRASAQAQPQPAGQQGAGRGNQGQSQAPGRGRATYSLSDPVPQDPALRGAIDLHVHQDPDSFGPSYGQAARSVDAMDMVKRAKAAGMRGFVIKQHLDQTAGLAYYMRKLYPEMEIFGGMGSNLTNGPKVNPWAIAHMAEIKGGWGRIVWMPSWDSENSSHKVPNFKQPAIISVARCADGGMFWANYPKPCPKADLLPEIKEAMKVIATRKTRDTNGDLILATGHNSPEEVLMMIREAVKAGVKNTIITHALLDIVGLTESQIKEAVGLGPGVYAEFIAQFGNANASPELVKRNVSGIRAAGLEHAILSSDTGQLGSPLPPDALAGAAAALRTQGFTERELDVLLKINPAKILGIAPPPTASQ